MILSEETLDIHNRMRKFFTPIANSLLIEFVENVKTATGIYLPASAAKAMAHPIVAIPVFEIGAKRGDFLPFLKNGDWVVLRPSQIDIFPMYGRKFSVIKDFDIMMKVDMAFVQDDVDYRDAKSKEVAPKPSPLNIVN